MVRIRMRFGPRRSNVAREGGAQWIGPQDMLGQRRGHSPTPLGAVKTRPCCRPRIAAFDLPRCAVAARHVQLAAPRRNESLCLRGRRLGCFRAGRPPLPADDAPHYVLATFVNGATLGDGLRLLHSSDGYAWEALPGAPCCCRWRRRAAACSATRRSCSTTASSTSCGRRTSASASCRASGSAARSAGRIGRSRASGGARSTNLLRWEGVRRIEVDLPDACSL